MFAAMLGGFEVLLVLGVLLFIPLGLAMLAFWIWMLVHASQNKGLSDGEKVAWILIIALVHFIGALIYFFVGRPKASKAIVSPATF
jgi:hypothetical protein